MSQSKYVAFWDLKAAQPTQYGIILQQWLQQLSSGDSAELRRCKTVDEVMWIRAYHRLLNTLRGVSSSDISQSRVAIIAMLLVCTDTNAVNTFGRQLASMDISETRFKRLIRCTLDTTDDMNIFVARFRELIKQVGNVNACNIADIIYSWNLQRKNIAFDYYGNI
jgi:CRISPR type I-E-associated protein CasB/Cse2